MSETARQSDLLTEAEAARRLRLGARTLRDLRRRGLIRYVALTARKIMYRPEDCTAYIESRVQLNEPAPKAGRPNRTRRRSAVIIPFSQQAGR